ncbi:MAG: NUDIX domain-containing protein [bacterium]
MVKSESAGGVIVNEVGEVAIVFTHTNSWQLPKGTVEAGEEYLQTAKREIEEETGITELTYIKSYPPYARMSGGGDRLIAIYYFLFRAAKQPLRPSMEILECRWVPIDQVAGALTYKEDQEFFSSIQSELVSLA